MSAPARIVGYELSTIAAVGFPNIRRESSKGNTLKILNNYGHRLRKLYGKRAYCLGYLICTFIPFP